MTLWLQREARVQVWRAVVEAQRAGRLIAFR